MPRLSPRRKKEVVEQVHVSIDGISDLLNQGPVAWGYGRISDMKQEDGDSVPAQETRVRKFYEFMLQEQNVGYAGFFAEPKHISAYRRPFSTRPMGRFLMSVMRPGDHLVVDKLDRLWRNLHDYSQLLQFMQLKEIKLHIVNNMGATFSLGTPMGDFFVAQMVLMAQLESAQKSDRVSRAYKWGREQGYYMASIRPPGCEIIGTRPRCKLRWDWEERSLFHHIVQMIDEEGCSPMEVSTRFEEAVCKSLARPFRKEKLWGRAWNQKRINVAYVLEKQYRLVNDPMEIPWEKVRKFGFENAKKLQSPVPKRFQVTGYADRPPTVENLIENPILLRRAQLTGGKRP